MISMIIMYAVMGLCFGSFFAVIGDRWGIEEHKVRKWYVGRSVCDSCGKALSWFELIPVLSFLLLKGRCRHCGAKIPTNLLLCELMCGAGWAILGAYSFHYFLTDPCKVITANIAVMYLSFAATTDFLSHCIEGVSGYVAILGIIAAQTYFHLGNPALKAYIAIAVIVLAADIVLEHINKNALFGNGDIQCVIVLIMGSGYLDINAAASTIVYFAIIAGVCGIIFTIAKRGKQKIAVVPFFYIGYILFLALGKVQFFYEGRLAT